MGIPLAGKRGDPIDKETLGISVGDVDPIMFTVFFLIIFETVQNTLEIRLQASLRKAEEFYSDLMKDRHGLHI
jgi:hypothetical protein